MLSPFQSKKYRLVVDKYAHPFPCNVRESRLSLNITPEERAQLVFIDGQMKVLINNPRKIISTIDSSSKGCEVPDRWWMQTSFCDLCKFAGGKSCWGIGQETFHLPALKMRVVCYTFFLPGRVGASSARVLPREPALCLHIHKGNWYDNLLSGYKITVSRPRT